MMILRRFRPGTAALFRIGLLVLIATPAMARSVTDSAGRTVELPERMLRDQLRAFDRLFYQAERTEPVRDTLLENCGG